jgi:signal transduction histidine kinase
VILWGANQFVGHLREVNRRRAALMHQAEYSNKLASLGRLAAGVAHEVNNPLAIIGEKAGLLRDLAERDTDFSQRARVLTTLDSIVRSVDRCSAITHRLLGFAKHMDVHHEVIDLRTLLREVLGFLGKEAEHRNISVMIAAEPVLPTITSDRGQLQQVFLNLLNNAFAAVTDGGTIEIAFSVPRPGEIRCTISDDGVGIPTEHLERIFEPFFTTKGAAGTGLGLSITHGIVTKLGGTIEVDSIIGQGTRFTVILPVERRE